MLANSMHFSTLRNDLEQRFNLASVVTDLEVLIKSINDFVKNPNLGPDEKDFLIKFRQKAYDRKRVIRPASGQKKPRQSGKEQKILGPDLLAPTVFSANLGTSGSLEGPEFLGITRPSGNSQIPDRLGNAKNAPDPDAGFSFWNGIKKGMGKVDGEKFITRLPFFLLILMATAAVTYLIWIQSLALYRTSGFVSPELCATGGVIMTIVFAAYYGVYKSWFTLMLCLYVGGYEAYFMVTATLNDEIVQVQEKTENVQEMSFLIDKAKKVKEEYQLLKSRYDNPKSKVFHNEWFKKNFMNKLWLEQENANAKMVEKRDSLKSGLGYENIVLLKIMYRLGLVLMAMILMHQLVSLFETPHYKD